MKLAVIQMRAFDIEDYKSCGEHILEMIKKAAFKKPDFIALPECAYPAYVINDTKSLKEALEAEKELLEKMEALAMENKFYIACGMVINDGGIIKNAAVVIGKDGEIIHTHIKSNMWHFDSDFYASGNEYDVFDTEFGKIGVIVCADGRMPEISAILAKKGAELIVNLANLTSSGFDPSSLTNPQTEYMLPVRSRENNVYMAVCCKMGLEQNILNNAGGSCVISPMGEVIKKLPSDKEDILFAEIDIKDRRANIPEKRPELYNILASKTEETGVWGIMNERFSPNSPVYASSAVFKAESIEEYTKKAKKYIKLCRLSHSKFIMLPQTGFSSLAREIEENISHLLENDELALVSSYYIGKNKYAVLISTNGIEAAWQKTSDESTGYFFAETSFGRIGVIFDEEIYVPEISRVYMLEGCGTVFVYGNEKSNINDKVLKSRAAENKIYVMASYSGETFASQLISPDGGLIFSTLKDTEQICGGYINMYNAAFKEVVPGTNVVTGRKPACYVALTEK